MAHVIGGAEAQGEQIGDVVFAQPFAGNGSQGKVHDEGVSSWRALEQVKPTVLVSQCLEVVREGGAQLAFERPFVRVVVGEALAVHRFIPESVPSLGHQTLGLA